jgi:hypothetical protein
MASGFASGPSYRKMVFRPRFKNGYEKMVSVPNLISPRPPKNLVEIMHLEGVNRLDGSPRTIIYFTPLNFIRLRCTRV